MKDTTISTLEVESIKEVLLKDSAENMVKIKQGLTRAQNLVYTQLESLSWLQRRLLTSTQLPPLRGWASSPDVLLHLHTHIMQARPKVVVEFGSGASTLVIADALSQNGGGKLFSIENSKYYGAQTLSQLQQNHLQDWVDLRIGELETWDAEHLNPNDASKPSLWYPKSLLQDIENIDLIWVDGPPGNTCPYSRYPALPALLNQLSDNVEVWMDDTIRQIEKDICEDWAQKYGFDLEYFTLEKGLGRLTRPI
ncbi:MULTISPECIES: class I SAM-dependent methyltransferase [unclassified Psychrobacter]|uniref:class I SAM-dependent methyltransferase n=2 Tax=Psychrobacter TaxID=497 RepID=UPI00047014D5|nr:MULTISPECIES: class I SAM-dependent methyltransferase [unclassified Psychrobacter]